MSEFSESVHVWGGDAASIAALARTSGVAGRFIASNERWATFVTLEDENAEAFVQAVPGLALIWQYADYVGLSITLFDSGRKFGTLDLSWGEPHEPERGHFLEQLGLPGIVDAFEQLGRLATDVGGTGRNPRELRDRAANALRLPAHEWLSPAYVRDTGLDETQAEFPNARDVG